MSMKKPRRSGASWVPISIAVAAGPDEGVGLSVLGLDQAGVDRCREARIVQLDGEVFALRLAGSLPPGRAELGRAGEDAEVGAALALALSGDELRLDVEETNKSTATAGERFSPRQRVMTTTPRLPWHQPPSFSDAH